MIHSSTKPVGSAYPLVNTQSRAAKSKHGCVLLDLEEMFGFPHRALCGTVIGTVKILYITKNY